MNIPEINPDTLAACSVDFILPSRVLTNFCALEYFTFSVVDRAIFLDVNADRSVGAVFTEEMPGMLMKPRIVSVFN